MKVTGKFVVTMLLATATIAVSCGGNTSKQQTADSTTEAATEQASAPAKAGAVALKDVNENNWQAAVKSNFGLDVPVPAGWSFKSVESPNKRTNLKLFLNIGGTTTGEAMGQQLFEATKALSSHGNYKGVPDWDNDKVIAGSAVNDISEVDKSSGPNVIAQWCFTTGSKSVMVSYYSTGGNVAEYTFTINSTKE